MKFALRQPVVRFTSPTAKLQRSHYLNTAPSAIEVGIRFWRKVRLHRHETVVVRAKRFLWFRWWSATVRRSA